ncbi:MAG TPA: hypothetical protein VM733_17700 [Thermoanaerobaculia bacterium]|nr:hypothetical protein [Thermoanaerobaculia bacterium]
MQQLDDITADIRRQRKIIDDALESTATRSGHAAELFAKIEDLRRRVEKTRLLFEASQRSR